MREQNPARPRAIEVNRPYRFGGQRTPLQDREQIAQGVFLSVQLENR